MSHRTLVGLSNGVCCQNVLVVLGDGLPTYPVAQRLSNITKRFGDFGEGLPPPLADGDAGNSDLSGACGALGALPDGEEERGGVSANGGRDPIVLLRRICERFVFTISASRSNIV